MGGWSGCEHADCHWAGLGGWEGGRLGRGGVGMAGSEANWRCTPTGSANRVQKGQDDAEHTAGRVPMATWRALLTFPRVAMVTYRQC